jgi:endonuclease III
MNVSGARKSGRRSVGRRFLVAQDGSTMPWVQYRDRLTAREKLVIAATTLAKSKRRALDRMMGRAAGWHGLIGNKANYKALRYETLARLAPVERKSRVSSICRTAGIRMPDLKAKYILGCFDAVRAMGGPEAAKEQLLSRNGREAKIRFLKTLPGIGDKYARNIMMDVYHVDFRNCIAVDIRIKSISEMLGLSFAGYEDHEAYYLDVARSAGLNGWELDRLMFNYLNEFKAALRSF